MLPEILAPAGSMESLTAALRTGADAVYVGGKRFSARNNAENLTLDELREAAYQCHIHGAMLYLAVNTVISDGELDDFCGYIKSAAATGVDAFIVQDLGAAEIIRRAVPNAVLHASTQMSIHTASGAELLSELGYDRVVPAREIPSDAISRICEKDIEVEVFVHGALCMSVSGQCYMSAMIGSRSANRGCCGQACRLPFSSVGNKSRAVLSLKDNSLLGHTDELCKIGVDSLKIEGRMKRPEYIAASVSELKKVLDGGEPDMTMLRGIFSRGGFTDGYFSGNLRDMFGVREKDDVIAAKDIFPKLHELYRREVPVFEVDLHALIKAGEPIRLTASSCGISAEISGNIPDMAKNAPTDLAMLTKQLSKLGDTVFSAGKITADIDNGLFVPSGVLNELRRNVIAQLTDRIAEHEKPRAEITSYRPELPMIKRRPRDGELPLRVFCRTAEQALAASKSAEFLMIPMNLLDDDRVARLPKDKVIISPPRFITNEDEITEKLGILRKNGYEHLLCHTLDTAAIGRKLGFTLHGSFTMNLFNSMTAEYLRELGFADCIASIELTTAQIGDLRTLLPIGTVVYGRLPLMLTRNCPIKNEVGCAKCTHELVDRTDRHLPVVCCGDHVEILNSDVLYMGDRLDEINTASFGVLMLHDESAEETARALANKKPSGNITRGLYYRGVTEK